MPAENTKPFPFNIVITKDKILLLFALLFSVFLLRNLHQSIFSTLLVGAIFTLFIIENNILKTLQFWLALLILFIFHLFLTYYAAGNHEFLYGYIVLNIVSYYYFDKNEIILKTGFRYFIILIMLLAAIQKLLSPQFMSGDFFYYGINIGELFTPLLSDPFHSEIIQKNNILIESLQKIDPNLHQSIYLIDVLENSKPIALILSWITIVAEFLIALLFVFIPTKKITHILLIATLMGIFIIRLETGFLASICLMACFITTSNTLRLIYVGLSILFITFFLNGYGLY